MNLWPVEHFLTGHLANPSKSEEKKCSTGQRFICTKVTSYKIHTLAVQYEDVHVLESFRRPCIDCENL